MQVDVADNGTLGKKVNVSFSPDEVRSRRERVLRELSGKVKLPGFRPGKSSVAVVEKRFGAEASARAEEELANEGLNEAVKQHQLKPIGPVKATDTNRDQGLRLTFAFEIRPTVTLPDPKALSITKEEVAIGDAEIDEALQSLARRAGTLSPLAEGETLATDDSITLTGKVTVGDKVARELHDFHHLVGAYPLLGKQPEEVVALVAGKKVGDALAFATTLPKTFAPAEFAGAEAQVSVTVQSANRNRPAALDDELAKKTGLADLAALRQALKDNLARSKENQLHQRQLDELTADLMAKVQVQLPPQLLAALVEDRVRGAVAQLEANGPADADAKAKAEAEARKGAEDALKRHIVVAAISEQHKVGVTRDDLEMQIRMAAARSGQTPEAISKRLMDSGKLNDVVEEIREAKALETYLDLALGREVKCAEDHVHGPDCKH